MLDTITIEYKLENAPTKEYPEMVKDLVDRANDRKLFFAINKNQSMVFNDTQREIIIEALSKLGLPLLDKDKQTQEEKVKYRKIEEIIHKLAFGK